MLAFALLGIGAIVASATGHQDKEGAAHDTIAFVLAAVLSCFLGLRWIEDSAELYPLQMARFTLFICALVTTALLVAAHFTPVLGAVSLWYGGIRFRGWAENPNQIALFALTMPFFGLYLMQRAHGPWRKTAYLVAVAGAVAVGIASLSDALRVAWTGTLCTIGGILWLRSIAHARGWSLAVPFFLVPFTVIFLGIAFGDDIVLKVHDVAQRIYEEGEQGEKRFILWSSGLEAIRQSPIVGFGPGAYSGDLGPFESSEAHNSWIDWGMSTGILGIALHVGMLAWCASRTLRAGSLCLFAIVESLAIFSFFGYSLRQPMYWLALVLALALAERAALFRAVPDTSNGRVPARLPLGPAWQQSSRQPSVWQTDQIENR
jgi:hypothetical protein